MHDYPILDSKWFYNDVWYLDSKWSDECIILFYQAWKNYKSRSKMINMPNHELYYSYLVVQNNGVKDLKLLPLINIYILLILFYQINY